MCSPHGVSEVIGCSLRLGYKKDTNRVKNDALLNFSFTFTHVFVAAVRNHVGGGSGRHWGGGLHVIAEGRVQAQQLVVQQGPLERGNKPAWYSSLMTSTLL